MIWKKLKSALRSTTKSDNLNICAQTLLSHFKKFEENPNTIPPVEIDCFKKGSYSRELLEKYHNMINLIIHKEKEKQNNDLKKYITIIEKSNLSIIITDPDSIIEYVNPTVEEISGYKKEELIGQHSSIFKSGFHDNDYYKSIWNNISNGKEWQGTFTNKKKDGTLYYEEVLIFPLYDQSENLINYAAIKKDITNLRYNEEELRRSQKLEAIGQLTGGIAHDFNNILTIIIGNVELALMRLNKNDDIYHELIDIKESGEKAATLVSKLLAFGRNQIMITEPLDLNMVLTELHKMLIRLIGEDINLQLQLSENISTIEADRGQIEQIIINLVVNARDAINEQNDSGAEKNIWIETSEVYLDQEYVSTHLGSKKGRHIMIVVRDSGIGMNKKVMDKIFEPFYTTKGVDMGTGLGLSTVLGIVKQNNGSIFVTSEEGKGTTFKIFWTSMKKNSIETIETEIDKKEEKRKALLGSETILIVEDEDSLRKFVCHALRELGYNIYEAANSDEAIEIVNNINCKIDLLFTDIIMPGRNGRELAETIRKGKDDIKVLFTSGYPKHILSSDLLKDERNEFIHKPYNIETLVLLIRKIFKSE
ncbi:MAG: PAS domain S-box protein [Spirochaetota bacterium]|nr:PAS domain S-box protein [Spirochaetota bacterium]